jgi:M6 family metalloprotease-like protein
MALPLTVARAATPAAQDGRARVPVLRLLPSEGPAQRGAANAAQEKQTPAAAPRWLALSDHQVELLRLRLEAEQRADRALGPHGISRKGMQRLHQRQARRALAAAQGGNAPAAVLAAGAPVDTLHVLLIRIAFNTDRSGSLTSVTQDGNFQCQPDSTAIFDPPPHNKAFFEAHLQGLAEYWSSMSNGRLVMQTRVLPEGDCDSYKLSDIADYGPGSGGFWTLDSLVKLVKDMILAADAGTQADGAANLADYDFDDPNTYIVFAHAGGSWQSNLVWEPGQPDYSPNDIPTFFVQLGDEDSVTLTSHDSRSGEPGTVTECSIVPESTSQDGLTGSIAAALYHEFGHGLGLPDLYSTTEGLPVVGYWDLMDNGTNLAAAVAVEGHSDPEIVVGLLPPSISIWCKWFLGWTEPVRVGSKLRKILLRSTESQQLQATESKSALLDVSPNEFFLLENRHIPALAGPDWGLIQDPATGVVIYLGRVVQQDPRITINTHEYDFFMPWPGGMLLWRVRQDRIDARIATNTVQRTRDDLGLELIEADGIQDIGVFDFTTRGFLGSENDAFRALTVVPVDSNTTITYPATATEISATTLPSTASTFGLATDALVKNVSATAPLMVLFAQVPGSLVNGGDGFPAVLPDVAGAGGAAVPLKGQAESVGFFEFDAGPAVIVAAQAADSTGLFGLYCYGMDGRPRFGASPRVLPDLGAPLAGPPASASLLRNSGQDTTDALVVMLRSGQVHAFSRQGPVSGALREILPTFPADFGHPLSHGPVLVPALPQTFLVGADTSASAIYVMGADGNDEGWSPNFQLGASVRLRSAPCAADLGDNGIADDLAYVAGGALHLTQISGQPLPGGEGLALPNQVEGEDQGAFWVLAWPQPQGPDRVAVVSASGGVWLAQRVQAGQWSVRRFARRLADPVVGEPALGDVDGDGKLELVIATAGYIAVLNADGLDRTGFPQRVRELHFLREDQVDAAASTPLVADVDGDGIAEIVFLSRYGLLYALEHDGHPTPGYPKLASAGGASAPLVADFTLAAGATPQRALFLYEALGDTLHGAGAPDTAHRSRSARLAAVELPAPAPAVERSAEWLGRGAGLARTARGGPAGVVRPDAGLIAQEDFRPHVIPNPVHGTTARVRFYSGADQTAHVTVYDLEGQQVLQASGPAAAGITSELAWGARPLVPGPYICRLDYVGPAGPASELLTFYVER